MLNLEIELDGITAKSVLVHSWDPERVAKMQTELNSRYTKVVPVEKVDDLIGKVDMPNLAAIAIDFKGLTFPLAHTNLILLKRMLANRNFMRIPLFISWDGATEEGVKELQKMGFQGANKGTLLGDFPKWATAFTQDPSRVY